MNIQVTALLFFLLMIVSLLFSFSYNPPGESVQPCPSTQDIQSLKLELIQMREVLDNCSKPDIIQASFLESLKLKVQICQNTIKQYNQQIFQLKNKKVSEYTYDDCIKKLKLCEKQIVMIIEEKTE